jgi:hypothetical protein
MIIIVPTTGEFRGKVFYTKCTEKEFVIGQMLRCSGMDLLENRDKILSWRGWRGRRCTKFEVNRTNIE